MTTVIQLALLACAAPPFHDGPHSHSHDAVSREAVRLVHTLEEAPSEPRSPFLHDFAEERRRTVDYLPLVSRQDQRGVRLDAMSLDQRLATHGLLRAVLSDEGYLRAQSIRSLEEVLRAVENGDGRVRNEGAYTVQFFGRPSAPAAGGGAGTKKLGQPWSFKLEGHHLSINAAVVEGEFRGTPLFLGVNPAEVRTGPYAGLTALGPPLRLARMLLESFDDGQRDAATSEEFDTSARIAVGAVRFPALESGLSAAAMTPGQRQLLHRLIASYAGNLRTDFAAAELARMENAGLDKLTFTWIGSTVPGEAFTYVVRGPTVAIQFDAIEDRPGTGANHFHSLWSDPERDFGADLLARHQAEDHGGH